MSEEENNFFERCFDIIASLKVENENQVIAKEVVLDEISNLQEENSQLKERIEKAIEYNKQLSKLYDIGSMERSNADTNLLILGDKETINLLKGDKE